ncbi:MAG: ABC transporter permease subunit [Chloroflexi bacterium]|nr:ABC transporter permease subunit [Chloroflexota bacterium]
MPALSAITLTKIYREGDQQYVLMRGLDLTVEHGEFVVVTGGQGSGKSTLLRILGGLEKPTAGTVHIEDQDLTQLSPWARAKVRANRLGFLFRQPLLLEEQSVLQNVMLPLRYSNIPRAEGRARAERLLARVGLADKANLPAKSLSLAEKQRLALARALVNGPAVVLADEPAGDLSDEEARALADLMRALCDEEGVAFLIAESDARISRVADRVVRMEDIARPEQGYAVAWLPSELASPQRALSDGELLSQIYESELAAIFKPFMPLINLIVRPIVFALIASVFIVYFCFFGLRVAEYGRYGASVDVLDTAVRAAIHTGQYLTNVVTKGDFGLYNTGFGSIYYWRESSARPILDLVRPTVSKSLALLFLSMLLGAVIGVPLGIGAALTRHGRLSLAFLVLAIVGVSAPSFFLGLLLQIVVITFYKSTGIRLAPIGGFGWDAHIILPALTLAARPIAQVARVSFVALAEVLETDYIRTARAKGLNGRAVLFDHALRNAGVPILTALGTSLRFSLSSLPVVEILFNWPGMGETLWGAIRQGQIELATTLILFLGVFFILINQTLDILYRRIDPRLREEHVQLRTKRSGLDILANVVFSIRDAFERLSERLPGGRKAPEFRLAQLLKGNHEKHRPPTAEELRRAQVIAAERRRAWVQSTLGSLSFMLGAIVVVGLVVVVVLGPQLAPHDPSQTHSYFDIDGKWIVPPLSPGHGYPLGTDQQGRDILSLLLVGARRTMTIAFFAVLARVLLGAVVGCLAGWFSDSLLDRALMSVTEVMAAFPTLLLAVVIIYALGIRQGLMVFVVALCVVGWGETAQYVRSQVMSIRERDYVEGALAVGLGDVAILLRHVLPNLLPSLVVLACLEMGGVLMLLGELGFMGVFIGGGFTTSSMSDTGLTYFDIPEWGVMLSNTWRYFRSAPWTTFYPALAFTIAILGFNLFGEGLRRLTERLTVSLNRLFSRYTLAAAAAVVALVFFTAEGTGPWRVYGPQAQQFNVERAMQDISYLASPELDGRLTGTRGAQLAAEYIAKQMEAAGVQSAGEEVNGQWTYFQTIPWDVRDLTAVPSLQVWDRAGQELGPWTYGQDFSETYGSPSQVGSFEGEVICIGFGPGTVTYPEQGMISSVELGNFVAMVDAQSLQPIYSLFRYYTAYSPGALLIVVESPQAWARRNLLYPQSGTNADVPYLYITPEVADAILKDSGYTFRELQQTWQQLSAGQGFSMHTGARARVSIESEKRSVPVINVLGFIPGTDTALDDEAIIVLAPYDGLGRRIDGVLYPGANDSASSVAVMLEIARLWKDLDFRPKRTVIFVAWGGSERHLEPRVDHFLRARPGFIESYGIIAVLDLVGIGSGTGNGIHLQESTSDRLTGFFRTVGKRAGVNISTLGTGFTPPRADKNLPWVRLTWDGSVYLSHTPEDTPENIDPQKLGQAGRALALALMVLSREPTY